MRASKASPPTTPPAIAPVLVDVDSMWRLEEVDGTVWRAVDSGMGGYVGDIGSVESEEGITEGDESVADNVG